MSNRQMGTLVVSYSLATSPQLDSPQGCDVPVTEEMMSLLLLTSPQQTQSPCLTRAAELSRAPPSFEFSSLAKCKRRAQSSGTERV